MSRQGEQCGQARDELLAKRIGFMEPLPPAFKADGRRLTAVHPDCGDETTYRICPACHSQLPVRFGRVTSRMIAMIGAKDTGKTVYTTVLIHELMNTIGSRFDVAVVGCDDKTRERFVKDQRQLYDEHELFDPTKTAQAGGGVVAPLVFLLTTEKQGRLRLLGSRHSLFSFFDTAGEDLISQESVDRNARYLTSADGIILLLDPLQMRGARSLAAPGSRLPDAARDIDHPVSVLSRVTDLLQARGSRRRGKITKPFALALSKLDALWHTLPEGNPLRQPSPNGSACDTQDSLDVDAYVQALLHEWEGGQIDQIMRKHYARYRYFGLSALGETPTRANRVADRGIRPHRVADPFLWLLSEFGTIPATRV
jgi:hypothetical protein